MQNRSLLFFLALAGVSLMGAGIVLRADQPARTLPAGQRPFADLAARQEQITRITLTEGKQALTFERQGEAWGLQEKSGYPVAPEKIRQFLVDLTEVETLEAKTNKPELLNRLDLDEGETSRARRLRFYAGDTLAADVWLGKLRSAALNAAALGLDKPMLYLRKAEENQAWLVESRLNPKMEAVAYLEKDLFDLSQDKVTSVHLIPAEGPAVEIARAPDDAAPPNFLVVNPPKTLVSKKGWEVGGIAAVLEGMSFEDVRAARELPLEGAKVEARFTFTEQAPITITLRKIDGTDWAVFSGDHAALTPTRGWAYKLPAYKIERLTKKLTDLTEAPKE